MNMNINIIKIALILWLISIGIIELFKYLSKKMYFKMKLKEEKMRMEEFKTIENELNKKLNVKGKLHIIETIKYIYGHNELNEAKEILIAIFDYGVVLIDKDYKSSGFENYMTIKKEDIIDLSYLKPEEIKEYNKENHIEIAANKDDDKIHYLKLLYKIQEKEHTLVLSSERKPTKEKLGNSKDHHSLKIVMLMYSINSVIGKNSEES